MDTHSRKVTECEDAEQTGLAASTVADDDQLPTYLTLA